MSDTSGRTQSDIVPVDEEIGGNGDMPGISQPITQDVVDDILNDPSLLVEERQARLEELRRQIGARESADLGGDMSALELQLNEALNILAGGGHTYGGLEAAGMDPHDRADARSPDDDDSLGRPDAAGSREPR